MRNSYTFLGVRVDNVTMDETIQRIVAAIQSQAACNVVTVNPELVMAATKNSQFRDIIKKSDIVTPDGVGLLIMGRLTGRQLKERVTGIDLCYRLAQEAADHNWSIYLLGAQPGIAQAAGDELVRLNPDLRLAGTSSSDPDDASAAAIIADIQSKNPTILLVAYGSPTQELWIQKHRQQLGNLVTIGIGGSFDFIAGQAKRAPRWIQKIGLEWLWRLAMQPKRFKRMMALPKFAILSLFK